MPRRSLCVVYGGVKEAPATLELHIRGRSGFDVVGSPDELQAEDPGWPRKTPGKTASANDNELALAA